MSYFLIISFSKFFLGKNMDIIYLKKNLIETFEIFFRCLIKL